MHENEVNSDKIPFKEQSYCNVQKQAIEPDPLSSNLHRELQEKLSKKWSENAHEFERLNGIRHDLNDETVKRVLRVLSF